MSGEAVRRTVGVLGGLGPAATLDFFARVLKATPATRDQDHIRLLIDNNPTLPDRNASLTRSGPSPGPGLIAMAKGLEAQGADFLVMPCNTAHAWFAEMQAAVSIPFVSLIGVTVEAVKRTGARRAGLLATSGALAAGLYQKALEQAGVGWVAPEGAALDALMATIYRIKVAPDDPANRTQMAAHARALVDRGADVLIAGCTEVPMALDAAEAPAPLVSSTDVLVERTVALALGAPF